MQSVLITVDALRADHLGQYGYHRDTMPALDRLANEGTTFTNAFSNGPYTRISVPSFQTSQYLAYERLEECPTVASILSESGIKTAVIGTQTGIGLVDGNFSFDETIDLGRDEFHERANRERPLSERVKYQLDRPATKLSQLLQTIGANQIYETLKRPYNRFFDNDNFRYLGYTEAEEITDRALSWIESHADRDFFLWVHYMEAHRPYGVHDQNPAYLDSPVDEGKIKELMKKAGMQPSEVTDEELELIQNLYDSDIRYCSRHLDRLFAGLEEFGVWEDGNIMFTSDHGEEFGEHGHFFHKNYPFDELIHVPLMVKTPAVDAETEIEESRQLLDLAPTIGSFHLPDTSFPSFEGTHLFEGPSRTVFSLGQPGHDNPAIGVRTDEWKYITDSTGEQLYDLTTDPEERNDISDEHPDRCTELLETVPETLKERKPKQPRAPRDEVDRERLEALGYMEERT